MDRHVRRKTSLTFSVGLTMKCLACCLCSSVEQFIFNTWS